jgi:NDP-sugar pyrophosphorylase family protein
MKNFPKSVHGFIDTKGFWYDTGDIPAFLATSHELLQQLTNENLFLKDVFASLDIRLVETQPKVWVDSKSRTDGTKLLGPILIGKNVTFGRGVQVGPFTVIGDNCRLEDFSSVENSVLLSNSILSTGTKLANSIQFESLSLSAKSIA